jgi:glutathione S-transferase
LEVSAGFRNLEIAALKEWMPVQVTEPVLFYSPGSCSLAPHIILEEAGKPFRMQMVVTDTGEAKTPKFRRLNPKGRIPVLVLGEWMLTEVPAILLYLAHENAAFSPKGQEEFLRTLEWFNWLSGTVHSVAIRQIWRTEYFSTDPEAHQSIKDRGHEHLDEAYRQIESRLTPGKWAMASGYTILDPYLLVFYRWGNRMKLSMRELYPTWTHHAESMLQRPAVNRTLEREGISVWQ